MTIEDVTQMLDSTCELLLAPFTPFLSEVMYQNLVRSVNPAAPESIHLTDFPVSFAISLVISAATVAGVKLFERQS